MTSVTIPREVTGGEELVVIPRKLYEQFIRMLKVKDTTLHLNKGLREALSDIKKGKIIGPFMSMEEGLRVLKKTQ